MIKAQSGPDNHYMYVVAPRPRAERRPFRPSGLDAFCPAPSDEGENGSVAKALLVSIPLSVALWVPILWGVVHFL